MRRSHYLVIILLLIAQTSFGQIYQNMAQPGYKFSRARFDSVLTIPMGLGNLKNISGGQDTGQIRFNKSDSSVYVWNGRAWIKAGGGGIDSTKIPLAGTTVGKPITGDLQFDNAGGDKRIKGNASSSYIEFTDDGGININKDSGSNVNVMGIAFNGQNISGSDGIRGIKNYSANYNSLNFIQKVYSDSITNLKLNKTDTATMLAPYTRVTVSSYGKNATGDSTILLLSNGTRYAAKDSVGGGSSGWGLTGNASAVTDFLGTTNNRTMRFRSNNTERMVIDSIGNVGIGTSAPAFKLDVIGNARLYPRGAINGGFEFTFADVYNYMHSSTNTFLGSNNGLYVGGGTITMIGTNRNDALTQVAIGYESWRGGQSASAILDIRGTTRGVLFPRMTTTQRNAITSPATGLQVYNTTTNTNDVYNGTAWANQPLIVTNRQTANYTLAMSDIGDLVEANVATANTLTVPLNSVVAFPIGTKIDVAQYGAGQTTITPISGVTIRSFSGALKIAGQYGAATLVKIGTNEWYCFGNLSL